MPRATELVEGHIYYSVQYVRDDQVSLMEGVRIAVPGPVVSTLLYTGTQDEEGSYVFLPLPMDNTQVLIPPGDIEAGLLDLPGLKQALGYAS